jgi:hypothetical protein
MKIRAGYELTYECPQSTPMILTLNVHHSRVSDLVEPDYMRTIPAVPSAAYRDGFGNWCTRLIAPVGRFTVTADALLYDPGTLDPVVPSAVQHTFGGAHFRSMMFPPTIPHGSPSASVPVWHVIVRALHSSVSSAQRG